MRATACAHNKAFLLIYLCKHIDIPLFTKPNSPSDGLPKMSDLHFVSPATGLGSVVRILRNIIYWQYLGHQWWAVGPHENSLIFEYLKSIYAWGKFWALLGAPCFQYTYRFSTRTQCDDNKMEWYFRIILANCLVKFIGSNYYIRYLRIIMCRCRCRVRQSVQIPSAIINIENGMYNFRMT